MKADIIRLGSVIPNGVGGPEASAMAVIYSFLLQEYGLNIYTYIQINQIGNDLEEFVIKEGKRIHINIRYPVFDDFEKKSLNEKNKIRLDVVHTSLLRIAEADKKLDIAKLEIIKNKIIENNFSFDFVYKTHVYKKNKNLQANIIIHPEKDRFDYYVAIVKNGHVKCKLLIYSGETTVFYFADLLSKGGWKNEKEFFITGKKNEVRIHLFIDECKLYFENLTPYDKPPTFEMMKANLSAEEKEKAYNNWIHSLPPAVAGIVTHKPN